jgi:DNA-directed RNA polymerase specialized sigma24 family protein
MSDRNGHHRLRPGHLEGAPNKRYVLLYEALEQLSNRDRVLINEHYWEDKSLRQIAREWGVTHPAIVRRHQRILKDLRNYLIRGAGTTSLWVGGPST